MVLRCGPRAVVGGTGAGTRAFGKLRDVTRDRADARVVVPSLIVGCRGWGRLALSAQSRAEQRLRASVACLIDWLRIAAKAGWLGSTRDKLRHGGERAFKGRGRKAADDFARERAELGLYKPYGP